MYIGDDNMIYKIGMLCKHLKGKDLLEKNKILCYTVASDFCSGGGHALPT